MSAPPLAQAVQLDPRDNVATALAPLAAGTTVSHDAGTVTLRDSIPPGHKLALRAIGAGELVIKYGQPIGRATQPIAPGQHVHVHNVASARAGGPAAGNPRYNPPSPDLPLKPARE